MKMVLVCASEFSEEEILVNGRDAHQSLDMVRIGRGKALVFDTDELVKLDLTTVNRGKGEDLGHVKVGVREPGTGGRWAVPGGAV